MENKESIESNLKRYEATGDTIDKDFQMDDYGNFRIRVRDSNGNEHYSSWEGYHFIATLVVEDMTYAGVTEYHAGCLPANKVLLVVAVDSGIDFKTVQ